ncbi:MAG: hypothetical protein KUG64_11145 [Cycloclasticus sp.]|nr:hypothetical protein [Cycloclasticus sp.]
MSKLHEVLAVEADKKGVADRISAETLQNFRSKHQLFMGNSKKLQMDVAGQESLEKSGSELQEITTTVPDRLNYTTEALTSWLDVVGQKEATNQEAVGDIIIDGVTIANNVPATFLLGLETKLKAIRGLYEAIPTLTAGTIWIPDGTEPNVFRGQEPEIRAKTQKKMQVLTLAPATKEHPAQVKEYNEEVVVGKFTTHFSSGMISSHRKSELLGRVDKLIQATKQARQRANNIDVVDFKIGDDLFGFINQ